MSTKRKRRFEIDEYDRCLREMDFGPILKHMVRRVRWLYHNANKLTTVYDEKLVRLMIQKLENKNKDLEYKLALSEQMNDRYRQFIEIEELQYDFENHLDAFKEY